MKQLTTNGSVGKSYSSGPGATDKHQTPVCNRQISPVCDVTFTSQKGDVKVCLYHMPVRQLSMNGWLVTVTQVAEADGCWWLFQIATGFADIPRIVRIFPELCHQYWAKLFRGTPPQYCRRLSLQNSTPFFSELHSEDNLEFSEFQ